jgi:hypothetical protein
MVCRSLPSKVWCDNTGGTADGELSEGIFVFDSPGDHPVEADRQQIRPGPDQDHQQVTVIPGDDELHPQSQLKIASAADALTRAFRVIWTQGKEPAEGNGE